MRWFTECCNSCDMLKQSKLVFNKLFTMWQEKKNLSCWIECIKTGLAWHAKRKPRSLFVVGLSTEVGGKRFYVDWQKSWEWWQHKVPLHSNLVVSCCPYISETVTFAVYHWVYKKKVLRWVLQWYIDFFWQLTKIKSKDALKWKWKTVLWSI